MEKGNIKKLKELINLFEHNIEQYKGRYYDEANTRVDFIDKFFELLGWDIRNTQGYSEKYRSVVREDRIEIKGKLKAPDYCFRIGGVRKFFVEAKKPSVDIKHNKEPAFQLRRYAYTAKLPLSILTDFEEFAVYDTRIKPDKNDLASKARIFYCTYKKYEKEFDFIYNTFSKEAILKGSFDKYIEETKRKKGTSEVNKEFLKFIEKWRENLAKNIALRNKDLTIYELNYAVQKIIDRIIFLRIAEDRHIENYGRILKLIENKENIYPQLLKLFSKADIKYNSGLFNLKSDQVTPKLKIDDKILRDIIKSIYYPDCPYEFSVFDVEILGNIYEQFLGKTIRLTASHQAKVENKPEVKKAGGVYYTPKYIVDYIVKNTVGEKIKNKTPEQISNLKILDPACGSGSFLLGAYQMLMDYHLEYYCKDKNIKKALKPNKNKIYQIRNNEYRLTIEEKHRILLNNIFGVDIDSQAVEVTKLSLLLKLMEGESQESAGMLFKYSDIKMLPDLSKNIKCGNSLIGSDFYETGQMNLFQDEETIRRINVFDWDKEYPEIFKNGGFDVVIGNPPYIGFHGFKKQKYYFKKYFDTTIGKYDFYILFIEKSVKLIRSNGLLSFICPTAFMKRDHGLYLRRFILKNFSIKEIVDFEHRKIFENTLNYTGIFTFYREEKTSNIFLYKLGIDHKGYKFKQSNLTGDIWIIRNAEENYILDKISKNFKVKNLDTLVKNISEGIVTGFNKVYLISKYYLKKNEFEPIYFKPCLRGSSIRRYYLEEVKEYIFYPYSKENEVINENNITKKCPNYYNFLKSMKPEIISRDYFIKSGKKWYEIWNQRKIANFEVPKIVVPELSDNNRFIIDYKNNYYGDTVCGFIFKDDLEIKLEYILGILNSKLLNWIYKRITVPKAGGFYIYKVMYLKRLPIRTINLLSSKEKNSHDKMVNMVDQMLELQKKYHSAKLENEKAMFKKQIDILDNQIDQLVYELYDLTEEEIKIVEGRK